MTTPVHGPEALEEQLIAASNRIAREGGRLDQVIIPEDQIVQLIGRERLAQLLVSGRARYLPRPEDDE